MWTEHTAAEPELQEDTAGLVPQIKATTYF